MTVFNKLVIASRAAMRGVAIYAFDLKSGPYMSIGVKPLETF